MNKVLYELFKEGRAEIPIFESEKLEETLRITIEHLKAGERVTLILKDSPYATTGFFDEVESIQAPK